MCYERYGEKLTHDLVPGGGEIAVTEANREEYVRLYTHYTMTLSIQRQFDAFQVLRVRVRVRVRVRARVRVRVSMQPST